MGVFTVSGSFEAIDEGEGGSLSIDRRSDERIPFCMEECKGIFSLEINDEEFEMEDVYNISLAGMGFELSTYLDPDSAVAIRYEEAEQVITVRGKVVWCEDHPDAHGNYLVGILFDYSTGDENSQLFLAVKDYLDPGDLRDRAEGLEF
jgi:hypothetical protein